MIKMFVYVKSCNEYTYFLFYRSIATISCCRHFELHITFTLNVNQTSLKVAKHFFPKTEITRCDRLFEFSCGTDDSGRSKKAV